MFRLSYDLHIHSCLSPCANDDITPRSIVLLANMLGLNIVALTDHNSCFNLPAFFKAAEETDIIPIAGMELNTAEEAHCLCLFPSIEAAQEFGEYVYKNALMPIRNDPSKLGYQFVVDEFDNVLREEPIWLVTATSIGLYSVAEKIEAYGGAFVPAHIDRNAYSLLANLGAVPDDCGFNTVEIRSKEAVDNLKAAHPYLKKCGIIHDSDAHSLESISLPVNFIEVEEKSAAGVIKALKTGEFGGNIR